jgi:hypothetical protein
MTQIVVMVEETSMKIVAQAIVNKLGFSDRTLILRHQGKSDLEVSFPRKLRAWASPNTTRFIICRDNDGGNCVTLKNRLVGRIPIETKHKYKIRIVMNELEAWYLGDLLALESAGVIKVGEAQRLINKGKFRDPEKLVKAKVEFLKLAKTTGQTRLAELIGPHMSLENNRATSYLQFVQALRWASANEVDIS